MKVSYSWIKEFVDISISPEELADKLSMAGLSVASLEEVLGDRVYDIEVTSNRPDWLSVRGIVREVAAITGAKIKRDVRSAIKRQGSAPSPLSIHIDDAKGCRLYYGNLIKGVKVVPSPDGLARRLETLGLRPINNVVDITNYCLMEYGQPLHAFDFDKIGNSKIVVRRATAGERLTLIDGSQKDLTGNVLVIADDARPMAIAGIMGGKETEVSSGTVNVMLESAYFDPVVVRRGSRALGVASDSSYRFERGADVDAVQTALDAATSMICEICGGTLVSSKHAGTAQALKPARIIFDLSNARDVLSVDLNSGQVKNILGKLGFVIKKKSKDVLDITVPAYRRDVKLVEDITEEIARIYGYDKIPLTTPAIKPFSMEIPIEQVLEARLKSILVSMGVKEVITYSLTSDEAYQKSSIRVPENALYLENPLSRDYRLLQTTILPSLLECVAFNVNRNQKDLEIFEVARIFNKEGERPSLGIVLCGARRATWQKESVAYTLLDLKGVLETLLEELQVKDYQWKVPQETEGLIVPGTGCRLLVKDKWLASFGEVGEGVKRAWGIKGKEAIFVAEVFIDALASCADLKKIFKPIGSTPSIFRDISLLVNEGTPYARIEELIQGQTKGYLKHVSLVDCYHGKEIPAGSVGLTVSLEYGSDSKTLTDREINPIHQNVLEHLVKDLSLTLR